MNYKYFLTLLFVSFIMLIWGLGGYDIVDPDGPRFALVAKEMLGNHQWVMPHRNEYSYPDKPPFFFWCIAFFSYLGGEVNSFTARLPSAIAALGVIFVIFQWVKNGSSKNEIKLAYLTSFILLTSFMFFYQARMTQIDMLMCFFVTAAMVEGYKLISEERISIWPMAIYMGLGTITKGPIAFLLPLGACATYIYFNKIEWKKLPWKSVLVSFLIPLIWLAFLLVEVIQHNEWEYFNNLLFKQTIVRYANSWHHYKPFYYFLITLMHDFLPWTPFFLMALFFSIQRWKALTNQEKYAWCVCLFVLIFFSIPKGKRNLYILPIFPFTAYLVAVSIHSYILKEEFPIYFKWIFRLIFSSLFLLGLFLIGVGLKWYDLSQYNRPNLIIPFDSLVVYGLSIFTISLSGFFTFKNKTMKPSLGVLFLLMININIFIYHVIMPTLDPVRSIRGFMKEVISITEENDLQPIIGMVDFKEGFRFYGNQHVIELNNVIGESKNGEYGIETFWDKFPNGWLIIKKSNWDDYVRKKKLIGKIVYEDSISENKIYYLIKNKKL